MARKATGKTYTVSVSQKVRYQGTATDLRKQLQQTTEGKVSVRRVGRKRKPSW